MCQQASFSHHLVKAKNKTLGVKINLVQVKMRESIKTATF